jgi:phosphohistidine phosphatase
MDILLIRHGQAVDDAPGLGDAGRWLTPKGRKISRRVARWLAKSDKRRPGVIWTSPLVRAVQTAEILAAELGNKAELRACSQLTPGHDPGDLLKLLASESVAMGASPSNSRGGLFAEPLALVGHEPQLSLIANALLGDVGFTGLKKSGVLGLTWEPPAVPAETAAQGELFGPGGGPANGSSVGHARLWFVLDPARMKSKKRLEPRAAEEPAATTEGA